MFKSKSSPAPKDAPKAVPTGDATAAQRLTGTPTAATRVAPATAAPSAAPGAAQVPPAPTTGTRPGAPAPGKAGPSGQPAPTPPSGPGAVKRTTSNVKRILLLVVGALIALFAVFNSQNVQVHWIFGDAVNTPLIVVIAIAFVAGGLIGWLGAKLGGRNRTS